MTRDQIAAMALQGLLANGSEALTPNHYATRAVDCADELLTVLEATKKYDAEEEDEDGGVAEFQTCLECKSPMRIEENVYQKDDGEMFHCPPGVEVHYKLVARQFVCDICDGIPF